MDSNSTLLAAATAPPVAASPAAAAVLATPQRAELAELRAAVVALADPVSEAVAIEWLHELEGLKSAAAAIQARITAALVDLRHEQERQAGVVQSRRGKGLAAEVALARGDAPPKGTKHLQLAQALTQDLPNTMEALESGVIHEDHAQVKRPGFCSAFYTGLRT